MNMTQEQGLDSKSTAELRPTCIEIFHHKRTENELNAKYEAELEFTAEDELE